MGATGWRCAKTTRGIPVPPFAPLTKVVAFMPNGKRIAGFLNEHSNLLSALYVDKQGNPLPEKDNLPEHTTLNLMEIVADSFVPPMKPKRLGSYSLDQLEQIAKAVKVVRMDEVTPDDRFETLGTSEPDPWGGEHIYPEQWDLPLKQALAFMAQKEVEEARETGLGQGQSQTAAPEVPVAVLPDPDEDEDDRPGLR